MNGCGPPLDRPHRDRSATQREVHGGARCEVVPHSMLHDHHRVIGEPDPSAPQRSQETRRDHRGRDARVGGETEQRLYALNAWRETSFYSERERVALAWTESVTRITDNDVPDNLYAQARKHFSEKELVDLTFAIIAINGWNRLAIPFRTTPGSYEPAAHAKSA